MASTSTVAPPAQNTAKRDFLINLEHQAQDKWAKEKAFEVTSPFSDGTLPIPTDNFAQAAAAAREKHPKWFGTFPYAVSGTRLVCSSQQLLIPPAGRST